MCFFFRFSLCHLRPDEVARQPDSFMELEVPSTRYEKLVSHNCRSAHPPIEFAITIWGKKLCGNALVVTESKKDGPQKPTKWGKDAAFNKQLSSFIVYNMQSDLINSFITVLSML